jgi:hypothetical protein
MQRNLEERGSPQLIDGAGDFARRGGLELATLRLWTECSLVFQLIEEKEVGSPGRIRTCNISVNTRMLWRDLFRELNMAALFNGERRFA